MFESGELSELLEVEQPADAREEAATPSPNGHLPAGQSPPMQIE